MLDTRSESHSNTRAGTNGFCEGEIPNPAEETASDLAEPFPPLPANSQNPEDSQSEENRLRKAMDSVDLLQALDDLAADDPQPERLGSLDEILLAELGPDADEDIPQAAAAIDRQLLLSRIVKARDAILAEEEQAARAAQAIASRADSVPADEPAQAPPEEHFAPPAFDTDFTPEPHSPIRDALTIRRLALAVSVTALCIAAGWTLRSGSLPGLVASGNGQAQAAMASMSPAPLKTVVAPPRTAPRPAQAAQFEPVSVPQAVTAVVTPVIATPLAERMAPEGQTAPALDDEAIKQRLMETHAQPQRVEAVSPIEAKAAPQVTLEAAPLPAGEPAAPRQVASAGPVTQIDALPQIPAEAQPAAEPAVSAPTPRDPAAVETAMAASFGLDELAPSQRAALKEKLVAGECPSTALASLLGRAPVVATRDLVTNLENGC
jgi:hypothetical protein